MAHKSKISYATPNVWGVPNASVRGTNSLVARNWSYWLDHTCRLGGSPTLQSRAQNYHWPTSRHIDRQGDVANRPTCGPLVILAPRLKHYKPAKRQA